MPRETVGQIALVGSSHKIASAQVRDRLFPSRERTSAFFEAVRSGRFGVDAAVVLATCSRIEIYVAAPDAPRAAVRVHSWLLDGAGDLVRNIYVKIDRAAVRHLHEVAAGLDSIVVGEHEILGQIRGALAQAIDQGTAGPVLQRLFQSAMRAGRRARDETAIGRGGASLAAAAAEVARDAVPEDSRGTLVIVGAGRTAHLAAHHFHKLGWKDVVVVNRTLSTAQDLAAEHGGRALPLHELTRALEGADALVSAVSAEQPVLTAVELSAVRRDGGRPLLVFDLGNPRNVDPAAREVAGVDLHDLDDFRDAANAALARRGEEISAALAIVEDEAVRFNTWLAHRGVVPVVRRLKESFEAIAEAELQRHAHRFRDEDREALARFAHALVGKLLHEPITKLKEIAAQTHTADARVAAMVQEIFLAGGWGEGEPEGPERLHRAQARGQESRTAEPAGVPW